MNGGGCCTTRTWPPPSSTGSWNEEDSSASMDPRDGHVISNWRTPCQTVQNGSEYLEKTAQNFRNPQAKFKSWKRCRRARIGGIYNTTAEKSTIRRLWGVRQQRGAFEKRAGFFVLPAV